ncbi:MAG TPA: hypothetical protein VHR35_03000 [Nocardioides sp.]|nr:hypothetical protein [Nocardioides sp.]
MTLTHPTDDELADLLRDAFIAHEDLADPDRAVAIASSGAPRSGRGRVLLGAAAAVALVAVGTAYVVSGGSDTSPPGAGSGSPTASTTGDHHPSLPPLQTDAANQGAAVRAADQAASELPVFPGAQETDAAGVPELDDRTLSAAHPAGHTVVRSRFWTVTGTTPSAVAHWYAAHPSSGFSSGGRNAVGRTGGNTSSRWIDEVYYTQPGTNQLTGSGTSVEVETTTTSAGVGIRATVSSVWLPARPVTSFVQDVSSIDVRSTHLHLGRHVRTTHRSFTVADPDQVLRAATAFNDLPGMTPLVMSCPPRQEVYTDRIVFHTVTGDVVATIGAGCFPSVGVSRDGRDVPPALADPAPFLRVLGLDH